MDSLRSRLGDLLEPVPAEEAMPVDYSRRRIAVGRRTVIAVAMAGAAVLVAIIAGMALSRGPAVDMPVMDTALADAGRDGDGAGTGAGAGAGAEAVPSSAQQPPDQILVSVVGLVHHPGLVTVPGIARVADAIHAAGGMLPEANPASVNLAAPLADGQQILVGADPVPALSVGGAAGSAGAASGGGAGSTGGGAVGGGVDGGVGGGAAGAVNINTATAAELEAVTGIGPATAKKIVAHRESKGPFSSVDQLEEVPGIGPAKIEGMRPEVTV